MVKVNPPVSAFEEKFVKEVQEAAQDILSEEEVADPQDLCNMNSWDVLENLAVNLGYNLEVETTTKVTLVRR